MVVPPVFQKYLCTQLNYEHLSAKENINEYQLSRPHACPPDGAYNKG